MFHIFTESRPFDPGKIAAGMEFRLHYWIFCPNYIGNRERRENSIINVIGNELGTFYAYNIIFFAVSLKGDWLRQLGECLTKSRVSPWNLSDSTEKTVKKKSQNLTLSSLIPCIIE